MNTKTDLHRGFRTVHLSLCVLLLTFVTWGLISPDPYLAVRNTPLASLRVVSDIVLHCGAYGLLSLTCCLLTRHQGSGLLRSGTVAFLLVHGFCSELIQSQIATRTCDPLDGLANIVGIATGALLAARISSAFSTRQLNAPEPASLHLSGSR
ncbi:MAG: hypothetical protein KDA89_11870 [Planctomycetaceae bacterium]|nr:hypothetical protein [Planctomycetaceae bacterium]